MQPHAVSCPKCQYKRTAADQCPQWQCPSCGVAYSKAAAAVAAVALKVNSARGPGRREIDRDELETVTPSALSLFVDGRIGRLRYLAYSWPMMVLSGLAILAAVILPKVPAMAKSHETWWLIPLAVMFVLWIWTMLRLMALRLHDVNRSGKWVLALLLLPAVGSVMVGPQLVPICSAAFWIASLLLIIWPGSEGYNDYGPPAGPNTILVKVGAGVVLALMALAVVGNLRYMQYARNGKLNASASAQGAAEEQPQASSVQTPKEKALAALRQTVREISPTLPKKIDRVTTLTGVEVHADTYKVYYSMDPSVHLDASRKDAAEQAAKQKICQSSTRTLVDNGITVEYHYTFAGSIGEQTMLVFVPAGSCN